MIEPEEQVPIHSAPIARQEDGAFVPSQGKKIGVIGGKFIQKNHV